MRFFDAHNILPEYFVISVPLFNDVIKDELDEWLYLMKHSEIREDFSSPYMKKVADRLNVLKMTPTERKEYTAYRNESLKERDYIVSAEEKGIEIGRAEGENKKAIEIALNLLRQNLPLDVISSATGLSHDELSELKAKL